MWSAALTSTWPEFPYSVAGNIPLKEGCRSLLGDTVLRNEGPWLAPSVLQDVPQTAQDDVIKCDLSFK